MSKFLLACFLFLTLGLQSCVVSDSIWFSLNNEEIINMQGKENGTYTLKLDLDDMIKAVAGNGGGMPDGFLVATKDTAINFNEFLSAATEKLSENEITMFRNGKAGIHVDFSKQSGSISIQLEYRNMSQLAYAREHILEFILSNFQFPFILLMPSEDMPALALTFNVEVNDPNSIATKHPGNLALNPIGKAFSFRVDKKSVQNNLADISAANKWAAKDNSVKDLLDAGPSIERIHYKITVINDQPVKSYKGPMQTLTADKRTITFSYTLGQLLLKPASTAFSVNY